ncbi:CcdB family protein [Nitratifractor sp.]
MAQFDLYLNPHEETREAIPCLLDIQNDLHRSLSRRVVIPLARGQKAVINLNPTFEVGGETLVLLTEQILTIPVELLSHKVGKLEEKRSEIIDAIDFLIQGF